MTPAGKKPDAMIIVATPKKPGIGGAGAPGAGGPPPLKSPADSPMEEGGNDGECATCAYFDGSVRCLKFPPLGGGWAQVLPEDWCSFYQGGGPHASSDDDALPHAEPDEEANAPTPGMGGF